VWQFADLWYADPILFAICDLLTQICCELKTSANFSAYKYIPVLLLSSEYIIEGGSHRQPRERRMRDQKGKL
jgi:hypothetical protein